MEEEYLSIARDSNESLFKEKGSKFYGYLFPVKNEGEVKEKLNALKLMHPKARHHCYAYRLGYFGENFRANDDGEPSGSAGKPILNTLISENITFVLAVVVRYFGGTLLGVPGLINAYKESTKLAIENVEKVPFAITELRLLTYDFEQTNVVMQKVKKLELQIRDQIFQDRCGLVLEGKKSDFATLADDLKAFWTIEIEDYPPLT